MPEHQLVPRQSPAPTRPSARPTPLRQPRAVVPIAGRAWAASGSAPIIRRQIPTDKNWKSRSSRGGKKRSELLKQIDAALAAWNRRDDGLAAAAEIRLLAAITSAIETWQDAKQEFIGADEKSARITDVNYLEDEVDRARRALEHGRRADVATDDELSSDYTHLAVFAEGAALDNSGNFTDGSAQYYEDTKAALREDDRSSTEADIRIEMLTSRVREAHAQLRDKIKRHAKNHHDASVVGLFTAPEWYFKRPGRPFSKSDKEKIVTAFLLLSSECPEMIIVPGTILWAKGRGDSHSIRNTAVAMINGRLLKSVDKAGEGMDIIGYTPSGAAIGQMTDPAQQARARDRKNKHLKQDWARGRSDEDSLFTCGNLTMSLEICADHDSDRALNDLTHRQDEFANGVHVQVLISHGSQPRRSALRPGGVAVSNDGGGGKRPGTRQVHDAPELGKYTASSDNLGGSRVAQLTGSDQLAQQFMGIYKLPTS